jgi:hypothetical protein
MDAVERDDPVDAGVVGNAGIEVAVVFDARGGEAYGPAPQRERADQGDEQGSERTSHVWGTW